MSERPTIQALSGETCTRLRTGTVVTSLSSACKELIENSLDAGATCIEMRIRDYGAESVEVVDNGTGVHSQDLDAFCQAHCTSKLSEMHDLTSIDTFGFRGVALNALCAMSSVTVTTKHKDEAMAMQLTYDHNALVTSRHTCVRPVGTTVEVNNLFETLPVRRNELQRTAKKELSKMLQVIQTAALSRTDVRFSVSSVSNGKRHQLLCTPGGGVSLQDVLMSIFGARMDSKALLSIVHTLPDDHVCSIYRLQLHRCAALLDNITLSGCISSCVHGRGRSAPDRQFVYFNGRPVHYPKLCRVANEVYQMYNQGQYCMLVLFVTVPQEWLDVNVTPDKRSVMCEYEKELMAVLRATLLATFQPHLGHTQSLNHKPITQTPLQVQRSMSEAAVATQHDDSNHARGKKTLKRALEEHAGSGNEQTSNITLESFQFTAVAGTSSAKRAAARTSSWQGLVETSTRSEAVPLPASFDTEDVLIIDDPPSEHNPPQVSPTEPNPMEVDEGDRAESSQSTERLYRTQQRVTFSMANLRTRLREVKQDKHPSGTTTDQSITDDHSMTDTDEVLSTYLSKQDLGAMQLVGQFNKGFIVSRLRDDLFIIDQHASDEKYNFEQLQAKARIHSQLLIKPRPLRLGAMDEAVLRDNMHIFNCNGFNFQWDDNAEAGDRVKLVSVPVLHSCQFSTADIDEMLSVLSACPDTMYRPSKLKKVFASRACRKSVMIGTALTVPHMNKIMSRLSELDHPWNCPHGRPTLRHLFALHKLERVHKRPQAQTVSVLID